MAKINVFRLPTSDGENFALGSHCVPLSLEVLLSCTVATSGQGIQTTVAITPFYEETEKMLEYITSRETQRVIL